MNDDAKMIQLLVGVIIFFLVLMFLLVLFDQTSRDNACKNIGFKSSVNVGNFNFCVDSQGNYHYVAFSGGISGEDTAKEISVGGVRVAP